MSIRIIEGKPDFIVEDSGRVFYEKLSRREPTYVVINKFQRGSLKSQRSSFPQINIEDFVSPNRR